VGRNTLFAKCSYLHPVVGRLHNCLRRGEVVRRGGSHRRVRSDRWGGGGLPVEGSGGSAAGMRPPRGENCMRV
jgi:hypothetical protein